MAGQDKLTVSSIISDTLTNSNAGVADVFEATPANGFKADLKNNKLEHNLLEHAYALISFAKNEGIEPSELLAKILASGKLMVFENKSAKTVQATNVNSGQSTYAKDPDELTCFDDDLKELVF